MRQLQRAEDAVPSSRGRRGDGRASYDKRLLQAASAVGNDVPLELLRAVADLDEQDLMRPLARLTAAEFL